MRCKSDWEVRTQEEQGLQARTHNTIIKKLANRNSRKPKTYLHALLTVHFLFLGVCFQSHIFRSTKWLSSDSFAAPYKCDPPPERYVTSWSFMHVQRRRTEPSRPSLQQNSSERLKPKFTVFAWPWWPNIQVFLLSRTCHVLPVVNLNPNQISSEPSCRLALCLWSEIISRCCVSSGLIESYITSARKIRNKVR